MKPIRVGLLLFCATLAGSAAFANTSRALKITYGASCPEILASNDAIISTLKDLYERNVLSEQNLIAIANGENPLEQQRGIDERTFCDVINTVLAQLKINPVVRTQLDLLIKEIGENAQGRHTVVDQTIEIYRPMTFHDISPGRFIMGMTEGDNVVFKRITAAHEVIISEPFLIADTPVTQWQYALVMHSNPSRYSRQDDAEKTLIHNSLVDPDSPVDSVTETEEAEFLKRLNDWSRNGNPMLKLIISNHVPNALIRLPTEAEWEFVRRNRGKWQRGYPDGVSATELCQYGQILSSSSTYKRQTYPVAKFKPILVDGDKPVYDMMGNVWERVQDYFHENYGISSEDKSRVLIDPLDKTTTMDGRVVRGGIENNTDFHAARRGRYKDGHDSPTGMRLVEVAQ